MIPAVSTTNVPGSRMVMSAGAASADAHTMSSTIKSSAKVLLLPRIDNCSHGLYILV